MAFTSIKELSVTEALALTFVHVKHEHFTEKSCVACLCMFFSERLTTGAFSAVGALLDLAAQQGLVEVFPGPRGGKGLRITAKGAASVSDVDLPSDRVTERGKLEAERYKEANANPAPALISLLKLIPKEKWEFHREVRFVDSVLCHWRDHGWLSSKQLAAICEIGNRHGLHIDAHHYIGRSMDVWRQPYLEAERLRKEQERARESAAKAAAEQQRRQKAEAREIELKSNRQVKARLKQMELDGELDQLFQLAQAIFPSANLSSSAKATAYAGAGSKELRVCIGAVVFGKPPALVWKESGQLRQPGVESELWQTIVNHPEFKRISEMNCAKVSTLVDELSGSKPLLE